MNPVAESGMVNEPLVDDRSSALNGSSIDRPLIEPAGANKSIMGRLVDTLMLLAILSAAWSLACTRCVWRSRR